MMGLPVVAIVGRPNVGKSSLLNCLARQRIAIVDETPGVTRDRVTTVIEHDGRWFELVDTGGIGVVDRDDLSADIERQIEIALTRADLVLFVVDAREGITPLDQDVARRVRRIARPAILVANKVDTPAFEPQAGEFYALGVGDPLPVSAEQGYRRAELLDLIAERIPAGEEARAEPAIEPVIKIAIVGRRNVGKSTFINALAREERVIVSEVPGTTRDSIDVRIEKDGRAVLLIDTAGIRRKKSVDDSIEFYGQARAMGAIRRCDVALLMLDATQEISRVDKKIAELVVSQAKACVIVANKWDLLKGVQTEAFARYAYDRLRGLAFAPVAFTTAKTGRNALAAISVAESIFKQANRRVTTGELNRALKVILSSHAPRTRGKRPPKVLYATQIGVNPATIVLFVNDLEPFSPVYRRYIENALRASVGFPEVPLRIFYRKRESRGKKR